MFKIGTFLVCVCGVLLGMAVLGILVLDRQLSPVEMGVAFAAVLVIGAFWWSAAMKRMRKRGADV